MNNCGHKEAHCVIGNYWSCSICDKTPTEGPPVAVESDSITIYLSNDYSMNTMIWLVDVWLPTKCYGPHINKWVALKSDIEDTKTGKSGIKWVKLQSDTILYKEKTK